MADRLTAREVLLAELGDFPEPLIDEVVDFVRFLKKKASQEHLEPALLSQAVLAQDWLRPEEDEAWRDL